MIIPIVQPALAALALSVSNMVSKPTIVSEGKVIDYANYKCLDSDGGVHCTEPFLVHKSTCYDFKWKTEGTLTHTTVEVRDAASNELVFYRDTNGQWTPTKSELVIVDFLPRVWGTGNDTVTYEIKTCE